MAGGSSVAILREIQTLFDTGTAGGLSDRQLLERFASRRDASSEAAFELLVLRHGPMVLRVCRNVLRDPFDAQDAFQATFLVLVRRSETIRRLESVGGWLYGVACRVAARARVETARRRAAEERAALRVVEAVEPSGEELSETAEFGPVVQEEVRRLPEKYRAVVVLCYWQSMTHEQAAAQLGCPLGTVRSRLARRANAAAPAVDPPRSGAAGRNHRRGTRRHALDRVGDCARTAPGFTRLGALDDPRGQPLRRRKRDGPGRLGRRRFPGATGHLEHDDDEDQDGLGGRGPSGLGGIRGGAGRDERTARPSRATGWPEPGPGRQTG